ncbi:histidine kinase [Paenibacillus sp. BR2-3]|uniref:sensor histidine kinase n=1 Tax=Paenibacillus sp. BR2-3 TaxID=3048494 RepID=UPI003977CEE5
MTKPNIQLFRSIRFQLVAGFLIVIVPLIFLLIYNNFYAIEVVRKQTAVTHQTTMELFMNQMDNSLEEVDQYLYSAAVQETDLAYLRLWEGDNQQDYNKAKIRMYNKLKTDRNRFSQVDLFFIYSPANDDLIKTSLSAYSFAEREIIAAQIRQLFEDKKKLDFNQEKWSVLNSTQQHYFLCRIIYTEGVYVGALVRADQLLIPFQNISQSERRITLLTTDQNLPMNDLDLVSEESGLDLEFGDSTYKLTGTANRYLLIGTPSEKGNFNVVSLILDSSILEQLPYWQKLFSIISAGAVVLVLLFLVFLRKIILSPIRDMVAAMHRVSLGIWGSQINNKPNSLEFELMNRTFNNMANQIETLKISVYEEQLNHQQAELKHLQLQVNPHFFLNSLNIIYSLARVQDYALIKDMTMYLVKHFRYTLRSSMSMVSLKDELDHIVNYLKIQEMRFPGQLTFAISAEEAALEQSVPLLIIQPFVENSVKYGFVMNQPLHISVEAAVTHHEGLTYTSISIRDNGKGFPDEVLARIQEEKLHSNEHGEHIGIWNAQRRIRLAEPLHSGITISNGTNSGAHIMIKLLQN